MLQVVADTAGVAHAAGGEDDLGGLVLVDGLGLLLADRQLQAGEHQRVHAGADGLLHLLVQKLGVALEEDGGGLNGQGAVHIHGEIAVAGDQTSLLDLPDEVQHLLGAAHSEGGDHQVAALIQGGLDAAGQGRDIVHPLCAVVPITVGGFDHQILGVLHRLGIPEDGLVQVAHIAAEAELPGLAVFRKPDLNGGRAQQMAHIGEADADAVVHLDGLAVGAGDHAAHQSGHVLQVIQGLHLRPAVAQGFAAFPLRLGHLDVGAVTQHDVAQGAGGGGGIDRAPEALLVQQGQMAGLVDMGVGQQHKVQLPGRDGQGFVFKQVPPLLHAAVHDALFVPHLDIGAAAGDLMGGAQKCDLHIKRSFCSMFRFSVCLYYTSSPPRRKKRYKTFTNKISPAPPGRRKRGCLFRYISKKLSWLVSGISPRAPRAFSCSRWLWLTLGQARPSS